MNFGMRLVTAAMVTFGLLADSDVAQGATNSADLDATAPLNFPGYFGINGVGYFHRSNKPEALSRRFELMRELGVKWDRSDLPWDDMQKKPGEWDFSRSDEAMKLYRSHGIQIYPILDYGANWRHGNGPADDEQREEFANYVRTAVTRYKGYADTWEVWNEPNILPFWRPKPNAEDYGKLLRVAGDAVHSADPSAKVVGFCMADLQLDFLERALQVAGTECFDAVSYHFYRTGRPEFRTEEEVREFRLVLGHYGKRCPIYVTEMGITSYFKDGTSEETQALRWMRQIMLLIGAGVERVFPFTLVDNPTDPGGEWGQQLGMTTWPPEYRKKPSFEAYRTMVAELNDNELLGPVSLGPDIRAQLFARRGRSADDRFRKLVAWTVGDAVDIKFRTDEAITTGPRTTWPDLINYTTLAGEKRPMEFEGNQARIPLSPSLVYVPLESKSLDQNAAIRWEPRELMVAPGSTSASTVTLGIASPVVRGISVTVPKGWQTINPSAMTFAVPGDAMPGWYSVRAEVFTDDGTIIKELLVWVREPIRVQFRPFSTPDSDVVSCGITLNNQCLTKPVAWHLEANPPVPRVKWPSGVMGNPTSDTETYRHAAIIEAKRTDFTGLDNGCTISLVTTPQDGTGKAISSPIYRFAATPCSANPLETDGNLGKYRAAPPISLGEPGQLERGVIESPADGRAVVRAVWTNDGLHIGADITDDVPMKNKYGAGGDIYKGDGIEIYVAPAGFHGQHYSKPEEGGYHFALSPGNDGLDPVVSDFAGVVKDSKIVVKPRAGGYVLDAFIPVAAMGGRAPQPGELIGWDVQLNDRDDYSSDEDGTSFLWNGDKMNWLRAEKWGMAIVR
ncbi:MAG: hypothetical protein K1X53_12785 [Candidatus Sumerlaeaceae bacterium]|nr:hypothetical protein [Candidatus Sumerlaeaceae bacterium]